MLKIFLVIIAAPALLCSCTKETCYTCPHIINGTVVSYDMNVCSDSWSVSPGGGYQTPAGQTYVNYSQCH